MKVAKYTTRIYNPTLFSIRHSDTGQLIVEYWIPDYRLCFNLVDGVVNVFEWIEPRSDKYELIEMPDELVSTVKSFFETRTKLGELIKGMEEVELIEEVKIDRW